MKIFITGGAGYVGGMLVERFLRSANFEGVFVVDRQEPPEELRRQPKLQWARADLADSSWQAKAEAFGPDVVVHCAFLIRQGYGNKFNDQERSNLEGSRNVFNFCFSHPVKKFIHFSSISAYGAYPENSLTRRFREGDPLREQAFIYGLHKRLTEEDLRQLWQKEKLRFEKGERKEPLPQIFVVRPSSISGPRGQNTKKRFGLLKMLRERFPFVPVARPELVRQFVHEDDVEDAILFLVEKIIPREYEILILSAPEIITGRDMAQLLGKVRLPLPRFLVKMLFVLAWHLSQGRIPTPPENMRFYAFPIVVDGSKINRFGFQYRYSSEDALLAKKGRYLSGKRLS